MSKKVLMAAYTEKGGAGIAMRRQAQALNKFTDWEAKIWVEHKTSRDESILSPTSAVKKLFAWSRTFVEEKMLDLFYPKRPKDFFPFFSGRLPAISQKEILKYDFDILNVHWNNVNALSLKFLSEISREKPVVFTLHDRWLITGGCPHPYNNCENYKNNCGKCPLLASSSTKDISYKRFNYKKKTLRKFKKLAIITPSNWLKAETKFNDIIPENAKTETIHYSINTQLFCPVQEEEKEFIRTKLNLPANKIIIFISIPYKSKAEVYKKQFYKLFSHLRDNSGIHWLFVGYKPVLKDIKNSSFIPLLNDELSISLLYNASDIYLHLSTHDNLPNTLIEASSSGIPSVALNVGGVSDIIKHKQTGELYYLDEFDKLISGLKNLVENRKLRETYGKNARKYAVENFSEEVIAKKLKEFYEKLL